jgi:hypothetical protein
MNDALTKNQSIGYIKKTDRILPGVEASRHVPVREVFDAKELP